MNNNEARAATATSLIAAGSKAATANATSSIVDISEYDGTLVLIQNVGAITAGSITSGYKTGLTTAALTTLATSALGTLTTAQVPALTKIEIPLNGLGKYLQFVGTIATGPVDMSVEMLARKPTV